MKRPLLSTLSTLSTFSIPAELHQHLRTHCASAPLQPSSVKYSRTKRSVALTIREAIEALPMRSPPSPHIKRACITSVHNLCTVTVDFKHHKDLRDKINLHAQRHHVNRYLTVAHAIDLFLGQPLLQQTQHTQTTTADPTPNPNTP